MYLICSKIGERKEKEKQKIIPKSYSQEFLADPFLKLVRGGSQ